MVGAIKRWILLKVAASVRLLIESPTASFTAPVVSWDVNNVQLGDARDSDAFLNCSTLFLSSVHVSIYRDLSSVMKSQQLDWKHSLDNWDILFFVKFRFVLCVYAHTQSTLFTYLERVLVLCASFCGAFWFNYHFSGGKCCFLMSKSSIKCFTRWTQMHIQHTSFWRERFSSPNWQSDCSTMFSFLQTIFIQVFAVQRCSYQAERQQRRTHDGGREREWENYTFAGCKLICLLANFVEMKHWNWEKCALVSLRWLLHAYPSKRVWARLKTKTARRKK